MAGAATTSCSVRREGGDHGVLETVARIGSRLATEEGGGDAAALESSIRELQGVQMTFEALEATKIGRAVNALRKNAPSEQARQIAAALYREWRALADERFRSCRTQQPKAKGIEKPSSSSSPPPPVVTKQSAGSKGNRNTAAPASAIEGTPETSRQEAHDSAAVVRKPSGMAEHSRVTAVRCTAAAPEPAPASAVAATPGTKRHEAHDSAAVVVRKPMSVRVMSVSTPAKAEQRRVTIVARRTAAAPEPAPASNARRNGANQGLNVAKSVSPTGAASSTTAKRPPACSSGACKRKAEAPPCFDGAARLERAKKRLHVGYNEASAAKEKMKIKEVKAIAGGQRKAHADERFRSSRTQQQRPKGIGPPPPVDAKQSAGPEGNRRTTAPASAADATPAANRHEGHGSAAVVWKPKAVRVMAVRTPGKAEQSRVTGTQRTATAAKPAPASNTRRNGSNNHNQQAYFPATASRQQGPNFAKRVSPTGGAASLKTAKRPRPTALTTPSPVGSLGACKRKVEAPTCFDKAARLERAKKRLREGYKEASVAKEMRKIKEIKAIAGQGKARQHPARHERCTAAGGTRKQAPVPLRPRMSTAS